MAKKFRYGIYLKSELSGGVGKAGEREETEGM